MKNKIRPIKVLIASPKDTKKECDIIIHEINEWNNTNCEKTEFVFIPKHWRQDCYPEICASSSPQSVTNSQIVNNADLLIALFWTRVGTPTDDYISGTVEEIETFLKYNKPIMLYFSSKKINPQEIDTKQLNKLNKIKSKYQKQGIVGTFSTIANFKKLLMKHLSKIVEGLNKTLLNDKEYMQVKKSIPDISNSSDKDFKTLHSCLNEAFKLNPRSQDKKINSSNKLLCGYNEIDQITSGFWGGDLISMVGNDITSQVNFLFNFVINLSNVNNVPALLFSLDGNSDFHALSLFSIESKITKHAWLTGMIAKKDLPNISLGIAHVNDIDLEISDAIGLSFDQILSSIVANHSTRKTKVVYIYNLTSILFKAFQGEPHWIFNEFYLNLKKIAKELDLIIVIVYPPRCDNSFEAFADLNGYGNPYYYSDIVINVKNFYPHISEPADEIKTIISIDKNKRGPTDNFNIPYSPFYGKFGSIIDEQ